MDDIVNNIIGNNKKRARKNGKFGWEDSFILQMEEDRK